MRKLIVATGVLMLLALVVFGFYAESGGQHCPTSPTPFGSDAAGCPGGVAPAGSTTYTKNGKVTYAPAYGTSNPAETNASGQLSSGDPGPPPDVVPSTDKCPDLTTPCGSPTADSGATPPEDCCYTNTYQPPDPQEALPPSVTTHHGWQFDGWSALFGILFIVGLAIGFGTGNWRRYEEEQESQNETDPWPFV